MGLLNDMLRKDMVNKQHVIQVIDKCIDELAKRIYKSICSNIYNTINNGGASIEGYIDVPQQLGVPPEIGKCDFDYKPIDRGCFYCEEFGIEKCPQQDETGATGYLQYLLLYKKVRIVQRSRRLELFSKKQKEWGDKYFEFTYLMEKLLGILETLAKDDKIQLDVFTKVYSRNQGFSYVEYGKHISFSPTAPNTGSYGSYCTIDSHDIYNLSLRYQYRK